MLLDEGRLPDFCQRLRRPALPPGCRRPELRRLFRRIHLRRRRQINARRSLHAGNRWRIRQLRPRHEGLGPDFTRRALPGPLPHVQGTKPCFEPIRTGTIDKHEPNPYQLEWDDLVDAIRQDRPYNEVERVRRPAWSRRWGACRATSVGKSRTTRSWTATTSSHRFGASDTRLLGSAASGCGRQVPGPDARHEQASRIRVGQTLERDRTGFTGIDRCTPPRS